MPWSSPLSMPFFQAGVPGRVFSALASRLPAGNGAVAPGAVAGAVPGTLLPLLNEAPTAPVALRLGFFEPPPEHAATRQASMSTAVATAAARLVRAFTDS